MFWRRATGYVLGLGLLGLLFSSAPAPTAEAQSQPPSPFQIITDSITFSVVGSGEGGSTQAKVNYQTQKALVNGIKVKNISSSSKTFNLYAWFDVDRDNDLASLDINLFGQTSCGGGGGSEFSATLNAGETITIPTDRACANIPLANGKAGPGGADRLFQWAAKQGWNSADLELKATTTGGFAPATTTMPDGLIWPAAKLKIVDFPNPDNYRLSVRLPGDNNTNPQTGLGAIICGYCSGDQFFGAGLLDPPTTTYKIRYTDFNRTFAEKEVSGFVVPGYTLYEATVSLTEVRVTLAADPTTINPGENVTLNWSSTNATSLTIDNGIGNVAVPSGSKVVGPINQDTTYKITATGPGGTAEATATVTVNCSIGSAPPAKKLSLLERIKNRFRPPPAVAQNSQCLPDLVPDLANIEVEMVEDGTNRTFTKRPPNIVYGREIIKMTTKGLAVKNEGTADFEGDLVIGFKTIYDTTPGTGMYKITKRLKIEVGKTVTLDPLTLLMDEPGDAQTIWDRMKVIAEKTGKTSFDYTMIVDPDNTILEANGFGTGESNNTAEIKDFMIWGAIKVKAQFANSNAPVELVELIFAPAGDKKKSGPWSLTDKNGVAWFVPTNRPTVKYDVYAHWGAEPINDLPIKVSVAAPKIYPLSATVKDMYAVLARTFTDISHLGHRTPLVPDEGTITIVDTTNSGKIFSSIIYQGVAIFSAKVTPGFTPGKYKPHDTDDPDLLSAKMNYQVGYGENEKSKLKEVSTTWLWPEPTRKDKFPSQDPSNPASTLDFTATRTPALEMVLPKECDKRTYPGLEVCTFDSSIGDDSINNPTNKRVLELIAKTVVQMRSWKSSPAMIGKVIIGADPIADYVAYYSGVDDSIVFESARAVLSYSLMPSDVINTAAHETFHAADDYYEPDQNNTDDFFLSNRQAAYGQLLKNQFSSTTGKKMWNLVNYNCAYTAPICLGGYNSKVIESYLSLGSLGEVRALNESFAEDKATLCTGKTRVVNRLNNVNGELSALWQAKYNEPLPNDYPSVRDNIMNRWLGKDAQGNVVIQQFNDWHQNCLASR